MDTTPSTQSRSGEPKIGAEDSSLQMSPFLRLPGEIRNHTYEYLFLLDARIVVPDEQILDAPKALVPGLNLLSSCRQIHLEATGILYSRNDFTISGHSSGCKNDELRHISQLGAWLNSIGNWRDSVNRISVDLSTVCNSEDEVWPSSAAGIDLSVIMKQSDMHPKHNPIISFLPNQNLMPSMVSITALNALLHQLTGIGSSGLDTCVRLKNRCRFIECNARGTKISFGLYKCAPIEFCRTTGATFERKVVQSGPHNFESFIGHRNITGKIFGTELGVHTLVFNINNKTISSSLPGTYQVFCANKVVAPRIFKDLESWVLNGRLMWFIGPEEQCNYGIEPQDVMLEIETTGISPSSSTCFDAIAFIWATLGLSDRVKVGIQHNRVSATGKESKVVTVSLNCLRRRVLHFLEFLANLPPHLRTRWAPIIWMDELCQVRFATFRSKRGGLITVQNEDPGWEPPKESTFSIQKWDRLGQWSKGMHERERRHREQKTLKLDGKEVREKRLRKTLCGTLRLLKEYLQEIYGDD